MFLLLNRLSIILFFLCGRCDKALVVLLKLGETTQFIWPQFYDGDFNRRAAFGHLVEGLLQQELPEVYNAFKVRKKAFFSIYMYLLIIQQL